MRRRRLGLSWRRTPIVAWMALPMALVWTSLALGQLPAGHPPTDGDEASDPAADEALPPGHPQTGTAGRAKPNAGAQDKLPEDTSDVDNQLPPGVIVIEVRDPADRPIPRTEITLGVLQQSVAKGESRSHLVRQTDDGGDSRFDGLETGAGVAYRVTVPWGSGSDLATYAASPFQLNLHHGQRVRVHVYPATNQVGETMLGMDGIVYMELRDDAVQFDELFRVYNVGGITWVPSDVVITLPQGFKAFVAQKEMSDAGWEEVPGRGARLRGTFGPGQYETHFRFQVPYDGDDSVRFSTTLPPHVARMRIMAEASKGMTLEVANFPTAVTDRNPAGQRILLTEHQLRAGERPPSDLNIGLDNIPTEGPAKWIATGLAAATVALGLYLALGQDRPKPTADDPDAERARDRLVTEILELEKAHAAGEVGPKAYEHVRSLLLDALARLLAVTDSARHA